jgi:hypothetical protein
MYVRGEENEVAEGFRTTDAQETLWIKCFTSTYLGAVAAHGGSRCTSSRQKILNPPLPPVIRRQGTTSLGVAVELGHNHRPHLEEGTGRSARSERKMQTRVDAGREGKSGGSDAQQNAPKMMWTPHREENLKETEPEREREGELTGTAFLKAVAWSMAA